MPNPNDLLKEGHITFFYITNPHRNPGKLYWGRHGTHISLANDPKREELRRDITATERNPSGHPDGFRRRHDLYAVYLRDSFISGRIWQNQIAFWDTAAEVQRYLPQILKAMLKEKDEHGHPLITKDAVVHLGVQEIPADKIIGGEAEEVEEDEETIIDRELALLNHLGMSIPKSFRQEIRRRLGLGIEEDPGNPWGKAIKKAMPHLSIPPSGREWWRSLPWTQSEMSFAEFVEHDYYHHTFRTPNRPSSL